MTKTSKFLATIISAVALSGMAAVAPAHAETATSSTSTTIQADTNTSVFARGRIVWCS